VSGHAYTILGTAEFNGTMLVKLRNPWGLAKWSGAWSNQDMTEEAKKVLGATNPEDGIFFMSISDFRSLFSFTVISLYQDWQVDTKQTSWDRTKPVTELSYKIVNPVDQKVVVTLSGPQTRQFDGKKCESEERMSTVSYGLSNNNTPTVSSYVEDSFGRRINHVNGFTGQSSLVFENLAAGTYYIRPYDASYKRTDLMDFAVQTFASNQQVSIY
jgi:hypothetical protein